jgi:hypothetical protein
MRPPTQATKTANNVDLNDACFIEEIQQRIKTPRSDFVPMDENDTMFDDIRARLRARQTRDGGHRT